MKSMLNIFFLLLFCLLITGCSDEGNNNPAKTKKDHVWKEQTDAINKAKEVEGMIMDSAEDTRQQIEKQSE